MTSEIKVAIVGCGKFGTKRVRVLETIPYVNIFCAVDSNEASLSQEEFDKALKYKSIDEIQNFEEIDLFIISTPNFTHSELIKKLLHKNANILCEKPLCISRNDLNEIEELSHSAQGSLIMGSNLSYFPSFLKLKKYIEENKISDFKSIECSIGHNNKKALNQWNIEKSMSGGGTLIDNGIHLVNFLAHFLNDMKPIDVITQLSDPSFEVESEIEIRGQAKNCDEFKLSSSWKRLHGYADITMITKDGVKLFADAFDDFILVDDEELEADENKSSIKLELIDILEKTSHGKCTNLPFAKKSLEFIFDCYEK